VPPLGLSNRALGRGEQILSSHTALLRVPHIAVDQPDIHGAHVPNPAHDSISRTFTALPTEEELATSTLWPEVEKVYGHGYEVRLN
jgi:hypothetical protein